MPASPSTTTNYSAQYFSVANGNIVTIRIGNVTIGMIQAMQAQEDFGLQPVSGIGMNIAPEFSPGLARFQLTCDTIYILSKAVIAGAGIGPAFQNALSLDSAEIAPRQAVNILKGLVYTIVVSTFDPTSGSAGTTGQAIRTYVNCAYAGGSFAVQKHAIVMRNAQFMASDYLTEAAAAQ